MQGPIPTGASVPHQGAIEQSLRFAGVDGATAARIAQAGPDALHPDLSPVFDPGSIANLGAIHGHTPDAAHKLGAAAYASQTQIALNSNLSLDTIAHEAAHARQLRPGVMP